MVLFGALAGLACSGDPTGNEGTPTSILAQPQVVFVNQGATEAVIVSVVDEDGQSLQADFTFSNVGAGITVVEDTAFQQVNSPNQIRRQARFFVTAGDLTTTSFVVSALGVSNTIQVTSVPASLAAVISDTLPLLGDTISITAPTGTFFTASSQVSFEGSRPRVVSQDATTIVFIPRPNTDGPAVVTDVGVASNPALTFDLATTSRVKTDSIVDIGASLTPPAPALGGTVTLTLPPGLRALPESIAATGIGADTIPPRGLTIADSPVPPRNVTLSPDSLTITFVPPPNADSFVVVPGVVPQRLALCCAANFIAGTDTLPGYALELPTTVKLTTPVVDSIPATLSATAPAVNQVVTLTRTDAAFAFDPDASLLVGADALSVVTSRAADGSSISFVPRPGAAGNVSVDGVTIVGFSLTLPAKALPIAVGATVTPIAGTGAPGTAPALPVPAAAGQSTSTFDDAVFTAADITGDGGVGAQYYRITLGAAATLTISISSTAGEPDLDGVICNDTACTAPDFSLASVAHDESAAVALPAGTSFLAVVNFDGVATDYINVTIAR